MTSSTPEISIRPFAEGDTSAVIELIVPIQRDEFGIAISAADQPDLHDIPGFYQHGYGNFWVAQHDDAIVGTIALLDIGERQAALRKMFVGRGYRGAAHGVAQRLLQTLLGWAGERAVSEIYLGTTAKFLAAQRFYEKNGFHELPQAELPPRFPLMAVDTKFYLYRLPQPRQRFDALADQLAAEANVARGTFFGVQCVKVNGKAFAAFQNDALVCKLSGAAHAQAIALEGASLWDPSGAGRPMKEWVQLPAAQHASWARYAQAALAYVGEQSRG